MRILKIAAALAVAAMAVASTAHAQPERWQRQWPQTDFTTAAITDWSEIRSGGPPKDGIPAIDDPRMIAASEETRLGAQEPVMVLPVEGVRARAYPIRYLLWHEIVNDSAGGVPVAVTYCPLCNSGMVFDRRVGGQVLSFGVSGLLRHSDMVMYDRQTESWWQQAVGTGIVGAMTGRELELLPAWMDSWERYRAAYPEGLVMDEPDWRRAYGRNPYVAYDRAARPFLYSGEMPPHGIPPLMRVVRVGDRAWTFERLRQERTIREAGVVVSWEPGQASALDAGRVAEGRDVGNVRVRDAGGRDLPHDVLFAFAFHAFWPEGEWMLGG
ncbi:DUF3179 domain-containing protein [Limimaricola pyoseonensis]|uniref:DUF3179 domain-containing protein n=1 Tax=Limimaricola pyoseonensis TaxID=521013 RepID=A0A1G7A4X8_9RHOB|nr:DUF3179 domain-containing protein [Limimaricola pyoseonensis]SDE09820.1 Protein of unknown function [Limimaricola pyoseonensis]